MMLPSGSVPSQVQWCCDRLLEKLHGYAEIFSKLGLGGECSIWATAAIFLYKIPELGGLSSYPGFVWYQRQRAEWLGILQGAFGRTSLCFRWKQQLGDLHRISKDYLVLLRCRRYSINKTSSA